MVVEIPQKDVSEKRRSCCSTSERHDHCEGFAHWAVQALIRHGNGLTNDLIVIPYTRVSSIFRATEFSIGEKS